MDMNSIMLGVKYTLKVPHKHWKTKVWPDNDDVMWRDLNEMDIKTVDIKKEWHSKGVLTALTFTVELVNPSKMFEDSKKWHVPHNWITKLKKKDERHKCICDKLVMCRSGCQCGGR